MKPPKIPKAKRKSIQSFSEEKPQKEAAKTKRVKVPKLSELNTSPSIPKVAKKVTKETDIEAKALSKEWARQAERVKGIIKRAEERGYFFNNKIAIERPASITGKSVERLKELTPEAIYKQATYYDAESGKYISGDVARAKERKKSAKRGVLTRKINELTAPKEVEDFRSDYAYGSYSPPSEGVEVIKNIRDEIKRWTPRQTWSKFYTHVKEHDKDRLEMLLDESIEMFGLEGVAANLQEHAEEVTSIVQEILYGSGDDKVNLKLVELATIIRGGALTFSESEEFTNIAELVE